MAPAPRCGLALTVSAHLVADACDVGRQYYGMAYLPTLYKTRGVSHKQPVCAICVDRTRGRTVCVRLTHGVSVWLCEGHASQGFQEQRSGRDFVLTLTRVWQANGCLTRARSRALDAHLARRRDHPKCPRPGSYAWPELRRRLERRFAAGATPPELTPRVHRSYHACPARPPSPRTIRRWHHQHRWVAPAAPP